MKVRLKPFNPDAGCYRANYTAPWGDVFVAGTWYDLGDEHKEHIAYLKTVRQRNRDAGSLLAFDVVDENQARAIRAAEVNADIEKVRYLPADGDDAPRAPLERVIAHADKGLNAPPIVHELDKPAAPAEQPAEEVAPKADKAKTLRPKPRSTKRKGAGRK